MSCWSGARLVAWLGQPSRISDERGGGNRVAWSGIVRHPSLVVSGLNFSTKALKWKMDKLNPVTGLKSLFSAESLVKLGMSIVKLVFIGLIVWS